jgi:hypothetical protein
LPRLNRGLIGALTVGLTICILIFAMTTNSTTIVSAVVTNVGVYGDSNCSAQLKEIDWGTLEPGSSEKRLFFVRNEGDKMIYLTLSSTNWSSEKAYKYLSLSWNWNGRQIEPWVDVVPITLTLSVSPYIEGVVSFGFDILIIGSDSLMGDLDGDGRVDGKDLIFWFAPAYGSRIGDENYNPDADFNDSGTVDSIDLLVYFAPSFMG